MDSKNRVENSNLHNQNIRERTHLLPDDEFMQTETGDETATTFTRQRQHKKRIPFVGIASVVFIVLIIVFAFYWEGARRHAQQQEIEKRIAQIAELPPNYPPPGRSAAQDKLNDLNWVDQDFLPINQFSRPGTLIREVTGIVIHNIGNPNTTAQQNRNYFANLAQTHERHASSHFIICLDGSIIQCVPVDEEAYAANQRNFDTLSIELCHPDETGVFLKETYNAAVFLTAWLCVEFGLTADDVIRHSDIANTECPRYFTNNEDTWEAFKANVTTAITNIKG